MLLSLLLLLRATLIVLNRIIIQSDRRLKFEPILVKVKSEYNLKTKKVGIIKN